jgi:hypothetical protein
LTRGGLARAGEDALTEGSCADLRLRAAVAPAEGSRGTLSQGHVPRVGQGTGRIDTQRTRRTQPTTAKVNIPSLLQSGSILWVVRITQTVLAVRHDLSAARSGLLKFQVAPCGPEWG